MHNGRFFTFWASFLAVLFLALPAVSATCPFLDVSGVFQANITAGSQGAYPLTLTNLGLNGQLIQLSGSCPTGLSCSFSPSSQDVLVPSQTKTFTLVVDGNVPGNYNFSIALSAEGNACQVLDYNAVVNPSSNPAQSPFIVNVYSPDNQSARPGQTVYYQVDVQNNNHELGYARLSIVSPLKSAAVLDFQDIDVPANSDKTVKIAINVPAGTPRNTYDVLFKVDAFSGSGCCSYSYAVHKSLFVFSDLLQLTVQNAPLSCIPVKHDQLVQYPIRLRNDGQVAGPFDFELEGTQAAQDASSLDATRLEIAPGDAQTVTWKIQPQPSMALDRYSMIFRVKYLDWVVSETPVCFVVNAQRSFVTDAQDSYVIVRGQPSEVDFTVRNNGTVNSVYTVTAQPQNGLDFRFVEPSFSILPGQVKTVRLLVGTSMATPLGEFALPIKVSDGQIVQTLNTFLDVRSSLAPGLSLLAVQNTPVTVYAGVPQTARIGIMNKGIQTQHDVSLDVQGLPADWFDVQTGNQSIVTGKTAYYDVQFSVPAEASAGRRQFQVFAQSAEGEQTADNLTLNVLDAPAHLDLSLTDVQRNGDQESFTVVVYNNGLKPLTGVVVTTGNMTQAIGTLAPGEQRVAVFQGLAAAPFIVQAMSNEGVQSRQIGVPEQPGALLDVNGLLVLLLVLILILVAIAFLLRKESLEKFTQGSPNP